MNPDGFLADLERKPTVLSRLADRLEADDPWRAVPVELGVDVDRVVLLGMGSSTYASEVVAGRLRRRGVFATAELASSLDLPDPHPRTLVVAVSASGSSSETLAAARRYAGVSPLVGLVNVEGSPLASLCDATVDLAAEPEVGGVASRSFQHTLVLLLALLERSGDPWAAAAAGPGDPARQEPGSLVTTVRRAAEASADLLDRRDQWLSDITGALDGPDGTYVVAPAHRFSSAAQSALMLREGPRRRAVGCETGDWSHVDVYLTKTLDYRMLLLPGSPFEAELLRWTDERGSTVVVAGPSPRPVGDGVALELRYQHDTDDDVRLLTEVLVVELVAQRLWALATP
jgi:fructoselysine-6-P-deglycase FrlB-like protein